MAILVTGGGGYIGSHTCVELLNAGDEIVVLDNFLDPRRGDAAICYTDPLKAKLELGWHAEKNIIEMCKDAWRWQKQNPSGYETNIKNPHSSKSGDFLVKN
jgi:UDP-glucose 4-epimerase